jgi:ankyrin repeat protein
MRLILKHGPDVNALDNNGSTPLHQADSEQAIGLLLEHGADISLQNDQGQTALHQASLRGYPDIISILLNHGADVHTQDNGGSTPLHLAISGANSWDVEGEVGLLLEHGANINLRNGQGQTALHKASLRGYPNIIHLILNHGAPDVDAQDNDGSTPLHLIISKMSMDSEASEDSKLFVDSESLCEVIKLLLEHGASGHRENSRGETPFQVAEMRGFQEITGLLSMHVQSERRTA